MNLILRENLSHKKIITILAVVSIILGALCCVLGDIILPFLVGVLAALYLFDDSEKRTASFGVSIVVVLLNFSAVYFLYLTSFFGPASIILARMLSRGFKNQKSKADTAYLMTIVVAGFTVISAIFLAMLLMDIYTFDAAVAFYTELVNVIKPTLYNETIALLSQIGTQLSEEYVVAAINHQFNMIIAYVLIYSFLVVGISAKLFGAIVSRCMEDKESIRKWRFVTSNVYAYFYVILALAAVFVGTTDVLSVSVLNLYCLFMHVFAYVGFNYAVALFGRKMKKVASFIIVSIALLISGTIGLQILAFLGVMFTIRRSRLNTTDDL